MALQWRRASSLAIGVPGRSLSRAAIRESMPLEHQSSRMRILR
ncbi:hypothetical protein [Lysobacter gummosus]